MPEPTPPPATPEEYREYAEQVQQAFNELFDAWLKESGSEPRRN
jgi:DNA gyrase inhibitor GyrI